MAQRIHILKGHSIDHVVVDNRLLACEIIVTRIGPVQEHWVDVTEFSIRQLFNWLGY